MAKRNTIAWLLGTVVLAAACFVAGYYAGRGQGEPVILEDKLQTQTFYAEITDVYDTGLTVTGLEVNDINFRGDYTVPIAEETELLWRGETLEREDLEKGDTVSITFSGAVLESDPAQLTQVVRIQLLDDER